jgi:conjugative relaxase-like TrwC/TraI family protein
MLAVSKLTPGQEAYYERSVAAGLDDYYAGGGESPGVWAGRGAAELELEGVVGEGELGRLMNGRHPATSAELRRHPAVRTIGVERIDPETGEPRLERKTLAPVAGYDLVFSPPKSVSLLHALGGPQVRDAVTQAHLAAWQAALVYLEREACVTRKGKDGVVREHACGFVAAAYLHRTSRAQDPHLHTHVVVANLARSPDGVWRALDGELLLRTYRLAAGYLYQAQLRHELSRSLGVEWGEPVQGMAELEGVPDKALQAFSRRREQVVEHLERQGTSGFYAAKVAALATRERKQAVDLPRLSEEWRARAAEHGLGRHQLERLLGRALSRELDARGVEAIARELLGPEGLTAKRTTFTAPEAVMAWAQAQRQGAPAQRVLELAARFIDRDGVVPVAASLPGRPAVFSTRELLARERAALALVENGRGAGAPTASPAAVERVARERAGALSGEQETMLQAVCASPDRVVCVVGRAGAGKTSALAAVAAAFACEGVRVLGAAPSGLAAEQLAGAGIPAGTLHRLLAQADRRGGVPRRCVLVVDEAGMADTRTLGRALALVERAEGKAILVGDPAQLPAVGAGGLFAAIVERHGAAALTENRRQRDELERQALELLRAGEGGDYLAHAAAQGRLVVAEDRTKAKARLVADWWRAARNDPAGSVMVAYRRRDVAELNACARALLQAEGRLGRERLLLPDGTELACGDRVVCARNEQRLGIANGTRGTIAALDHAARTAVLTTGEGRRLALPASYLDAGHLRHAYALTGHKTQGLTLERAFVLAHGERALREWGYVALSRARTETRLYTVRAEPEADLPPLYRPEPPQPLERLANALARPAAHPLALDTPAGRNAHTASTRTELLQQGRALAERRHTLERERLEASRALHAATRELAGLGLLARARRGPRLREQIAARRADLSRLDTQLAALERESQTHRRRLARETARLNPEPRRRSPAPERSPQLELDLGL